MILQQPITCALNNHADGLRWRDFLEQNEPIKFSVASPRSEPPAQFRAARGHWLASVQTKRYIAHLADAFIQSDLQ